MLSQWLVNEKLVGKLIVVNGSAALFHLSRDFIDKTMKCIMALTDSND